MISENKKGTSETGMCLISEENFFFVWCPRKDSNFRPTDYESAALTN